MKVLFEIETTKEQWKPPFKKDTVSKNFEAEVGESFFEINGEHEKLFKVVKAENGKVLIEFNSLYTTKRSDERPHNRQLWIGFGDAKSFVAQWANSGITQKLMPVKIIEGN